jgi:hypothetical protein
VQSQLAFALALLLALVGIAGAVDALAQEPGSGPGIGVVCGAPGVDGTTSCTIAASGGEQIVVPYDAICGTVLSTSGVAGANGYEAAGQLSVVVAGAVAPGGGATYTVVSDGAPVSVSGQAIVCLDPTSPADTTGTEPAESTDPGFGSAVDTETAPTQDTEPATDVSGTPEATEEVVDGTDSATPDATEQPGGDVVEPANVVVDPSVTPAASVTPGAAVTITVLSYLCATDPGTSNPASAGCTLANGVPYTATDATSPSGPQNPQTVTTDVSGSASFGAFVNSHLIVKQGTAAALTGYVPTGDGTQEVQAVTGNLTLTFVNVKKAELGRLQVNGGICPTTGANRTEWTLVDPDGVSTAAEARTACGPNSGAVFTVLSPALPGGSMAVRLENNGVWRGYVPSGSYTVVAPDGTQSGNLSVFDNYTSVAVAMTYEQQELGTLSLEHFVCSDGENGEYLSVNPSGAPDASCISGATTLYVRDTSGSAPASAVTIAANGTSSFNFKPGTYEVTSNDDTASVTVDVVAGQITRVRSLSVVSTGALMLTAKQCPGGFTPSGSGSLGSCTNAWGNKTFSLTPSGSVSTSGAGSAVVAELTPGNYKLAGAGVCAITQNGNDATNGFQIAAGQTTSIVVYGCIPDDGTGGNPGGPKPTPGDGTGNPDPGTGPGGDGTDIGNGNEQPFASNSVLNVSKLPNTGGGRDAGVPFEVFALLAAALVAGAVGLRLRQAGR